RRRQFPVSGSLSRQDARSDQAGADIARGGGPGEMVGGQTKIRRQRRRVHPGLRRQRGGRRGRGVQQSAPRSARVQELLGSSQSQAQREAAIGRREKSSRRGDSLAVSLLLAGARAEISPPFLRRNGRDDGR